VTRGDPLLGRSLRERNPAAEQAVLAAVTMLEAADAHLDAAWLLTSLVEAELRRGGASVAPEVRVHARAAGKLFAQAGALRPATEVLIAAGEPEVAAGLLRRAGQELLANRIAGQRVRTPLGTPIPGLSLLPDTQSAAPREVVAQAREAAIARVERGAESTTLLRLLDAFGLRRRAAHLAQDRGLREEAAPRMLAVGNPVAAADSLLALGRDAEALEALCTVPRGDVGYRAACVRAIALADRLDLLKFELDHLLGPFLAARRQSSVEIQAVRTLAGLYARHGRRSTAIEVLENLGAAEPGLRWLDSALEELRRGEVRPSAGADILAQDAAARGRAYVPEFPGRATETFVGSADLPPLPPLPDLPPLPTQAPLAAVHPARRLAQEGVASSGGPGPGGTLAPSSDAPRPAERGRPVSQPTLDFEDGGEPSADERPVGPGVLVAGRYRIESLLGQGGMGAVYKAFDLELAEHVALKVLTGTSRSEISLARFRQELKLARRLSHRNIVRVHDIGLHAGQYFISMELLQGADLRRHLEAGALPRGIGIDLVVQATEGLQAAHDLGVVHRDIKPENLFITLESVVKVMDFGIARAVHAPGMTMAGAMGGTACYMSPEQASDFSSVSPASDQYSLAVVVYEMLIGRPPFEHPALMPLLHLHATAPPPPLRDQDPSIPEPVQDAVLRALAKQPWERFESCAAFGEALRAGWEGPGPEGR